MDESAELLRNRHWRMAMWSMRAGYAALAVTLVGVIVLESGATPWVLAAGVIGWLAAGAVTVTGVLRAHRELPEPRPGLWPMRFMLLRDSIHTSSRRPRS